jgi:hypothetical protein
MGWQNYFTKRDCLLATFSPIMRELYFRAYRKILLIQEMPASRSFTEMLLAVL